MSYFLMLIHKNKFVLIIDARKMHVLFPILFVKLAFSKYRDCSWELNKMLNVPDNRDLFLKYARFVSQSE